jgi:hypothetical protein
MNAAERLYEQYQRDLKQLQETCPHEQRTDWMEEWWAPGHSTGREVKACTNCNKVLQARRRCRGCSGMFLEDDLKQGDGHLLPAGSWYCQACHTEAESRAKRDQ